MTREQLKEKIQKFNSFLQEKPGSEPNDIINRIELLLILISQSGECLAHAKYNVDTLVHSEIMKVLKEGYSEQLSPSVLNRFIQALAKDDTIIVNQLDRINAAATHQMDGLRSILSYRKSEMNLV